ncbi:hypothetical protein LEMLEM_LOCUS16958, partial [Lemmus lemmus]
QGCCEEDTEEHVRPRDCHPFRSPPWCHLEHSKRPNDSVRDFSTCGIHHRQHWLCKQLKQNPIIINLTHEKICKEKMLYHIYLYPQRLPP